MKHYYDNGCGTVGLSPLPQINLLLNEANTIHRLHSQLPSFNVDIRWGPDDGAADANLTGYRSKTPAGSSFSEEPLTQPSSPWSTAPSMPRSSSYLEESLTQPSSPMSTAPSRPSTPSTKHEDDETSRISLLAHGTSLGKHLGHLEGEYPSEPITLPPLKDLGLLPARMLAGAMCIQRSDDSYIHPDRSGNLGADFSISQSPPLSSRKRKHRLREASRRRRPTARTGQYLPSQSCGVNGISDPRTVSSRAPTKKSRRNSEGSNIKYNREENDFIRYYHHDSPCKWEDCNRKFMDTFPDSPKRAKSGLQGVYYRDNKRVPLVNKSTGELVFLSNGHVAVEDKRCGEQKAQWQYYGLAYLFPERAVAYPWVSAEHRRYAAELLPGRNAQKAGARAAAMRRGDWVDRVPPGTCGCCPEEDRERRLTTKQQHQQQHQHQQPPRGSRSARHVKQGCTYSRL
ncbi:hypothetical protein GGR56DRAFT_293686 [Xylariaceae sp. FL0804]|nr:hypothetical protein GGR56DRAFT_293686 [Xylariaceae sp. FL0804]